MRIFVDSNIFYSLKDEKDSNHKKVSKIYKKLFEDSSTVIVTSTQIFSETVTLLSQRVSKLAAIDFWNDSKAMEITYLSKEVFQEALNIFKETKTKNISFADCTTIAICRKRKYKIDALFSFDKHFEVPGIKLLHKILK